MQRLLPFGVADATPKGGHIRAFTPVFAGYGRPRDFD
jgi:hypothetical protein